MILHHWPMLTLGEFKQNEEAQPSLHIRSFSRQKWSSPDEALTLSSCLSWNFTQHITVWWESGSVLVSFTDFSSSSHSAVAGVNGFISLLRASRPGPHNNCKTFQWVHYVEFEKWYLAFKERMMSIFKIHFFYNAYLSHCFHHTFRIKPLKNAFFLSSNKVNY